MSTTNINAAEQPVPVIKSTPTATTGVTAATEEPESPTVSRHLSVQFPPELQCSYVAHLGEGSFGKVYQVNDRTTNENRAVKAYNLSRLPQNYRNVFVPREIDLLLKISHPNVIGIHRMCKSRGFLYIVMDYAACKDLEHYISRACPGIIQESQARVWTRQITHALEYMHSIGVVHRDLKCENILITARLNAKLADFGFARLLQNSRELSRTFCGTAAYVAPEIIRNTPYNARSADMWSLGVVLFRILNKAYPFGNSEVRNNQRLRRQEAREFAFNRRFDISPEAKQIIARLLEPNPRYRISAVDVQKHAWIQKDPTSRPTAQEMEALRAGRNKVNFFLAGNPVVSNLTRVESSANLTEEYRERKYPDEGERVSDDSIVVRVCQTSG